MTKDDWIKRITEASKAAGTYRHYFDSIIETLAETMEMRDDARDKYEASGKQSIVMHTNKGGATNIVKNPALVLIDDLNKTALAYWRDLGLTPAGLRRINEDAIKGSSNKASFSDVLKDLGI